MAMYQPTQEMADNARRGLDMRDAAPISRRGGTEVGLARANQFKNRQSVSLDIVQRTYGFLTRARVYYLPGSDTPGTQAYLMWGGEAGLRWATNILANVRQDEED